MYDFFQYLPNYLSSYDDFIILAGLAVALSGAIAIVMLKQETQKIQAICLDFKMVINIIKPVQSRWQCPAPDRYTWWQAQAWCLAAP